MLIANGTAMMIQSGLNKKNLNMKNLYYAWWADSIIRIRHFNPKMKDWKMRVFILNTFLNSTYIWIIIVWFKYLNIVTIHTIDINFFPGYLIDNVASGIINYASPFILLNYFLIFHRNRYRKIIVQYEDVKLNLAFPYAVITMILAAITVIVYAIFWS
jgi:hypothetical protein